MHKLIILGGLLLHFYTPSAIAATCSDGAGTCNDTGGNSTCADPSPTVWRYYCTGGTYTNIMSDNSTCGQMGSNKCDCGAPDSGSPCNGCAYQALRATGSCYSNSGCTTSCTPVPEIPTEARFVWPLAVIGLIGFSLSRLLRKTVL